MASAATAAGSGGAQLLREQRGELVARERRLESRQHLGGRDEAEVRHLLLQVTVDLGEEGRDAGEAGGLSPGPVLRGGQAGGHAEGRAALGPAALLRGAREDVRELLRLVALRDAVRADGGDGGRDGGVALAERAQQGRELAAEGAEVEGRRRLGQRLHGELRELRDGRGRHLPRRRARRRRGRRRRERRGGRRREVAGRGRVRLLVLGRRPLPQRPRGLAAARGRPGRLLRPPGRLGLRARRDDQLAPDGVLDVAVGPALRLRAADAPLRRRRLLLLLGHLLDLLDLHGLGLLGLDRAVVGPAPLPHVQDVAQEEAQARRDRLVRGELLHLREDPVEALEVNPLRVVELRRGRGQQGRERLQGVDAVMAALEQVLADVAEEPRAEHAAHQELADELHVAQGLVLALHPGLLPRLLVLREVVVLGGEHALEGRLALAQEERAEALGGVLALDGRRDARVVLELHAEVRVHGHEVVLQRGLLEDLLHDEGDVRLRLHAHVAELLVEAVELLDRELVQDHLHLALDDLVVLGLRGLLLRRPGVRRGRQERGPRLAVGRAGLGRAGLGRGGLGLGGLGLGGRRPPGAVLLLPRRRLPRAGGLRLALPTVAGRELRVRLAAVADRGAALAGPCRAGRAAGHPQAKEDGHGVHGPERGVVCLLAVVVATERGAGGGHGCRRGLVMRVRVVVGGGRLVLRGVREGVLVEAAVVAGQLGRHPREVLAAGGACSLGILLVLH
mmetsp:Transcript_46724/g.102027  ORF Transcript_46724/g.102027 Transcript_46724/m.102027 type:complete len:734 (+) Transcript_46724:672-2873(+)